MTADQTETYTFGAASYLNAAPLAAFLEDVDPRVRVFDEPPSQLMAHVLSGRADAAMVPVFDYFNTPGVKMIDSLCIASSGDVRSVWLKCHRPLEQIRSVTPDPASRSSNALARILLKKHFALNVPMQAPPNGETPDATVVIGDRALCDPPGEFGNYDLAGIWTEMTSLPFVYAVWVYRDDNPRAQELIRIAHTAKTAGMKALEELADRYAPRLTPSRDECLEYISELLTYDMGPKEIEGMELFRQMLGELDADGGCDQ
ncbi:MAG: menaquinone biosynthesis protein [bacterium]|nr:menaquinone biosynthesis protein [bacterium]